MWVRFPPGVLELFGCKGTGVYVTTFAMMALGLPSVTAGGSLFYLRSSKASNQTMTSTKRNIAVSLFSSWLISLVLSFSKYAVNLRAWDSINALSCRVQFLSIETPAPYHVSDGAY